MIAGAGDVATEEVEDRVVTGAAAAAAAEGAAAADDEVVVGGSRGAEAVGDGELAVDAPEDEREEEAAVGEGVGVSSRDAYEGVAAAAPEGDVAPPLPALEGSDDSKLLLCFFFLSRRALEQ